MMRKVALRQIQPVKDIAFTSDVKDFFAGRRSGHVGTWRYSSPLFPSDRVNGMQKWTEFVKNAKAQGSYYIVNDELNVIQKSASVISFLEAEALTLIDLGPGSKEAVRGKIGPLLESGQVSSYVGVDISSTCLDTARRVISDKFPDISFFGLHCDFYKDHMRFPINGLPVLLMFGQTLFNLPIDPYDRPLSDKMLFQRLARFKNYIGKKGYFIMTQDCNQDASSLLAAYGPEADFNLNLLYRIQRDLPVSAGYDPENFYFEPIWIPETGALAHTYVSKTQMDFTIDQEHFSLRAGQRLYVHNTYKYTVSHFVDLAKKAGLKTIHTEMSDSKQAFGLAYFESHIKKAPFSGALFLH